MRCPGRRGDGARVSGVPSRSDPLPEPGAASIRREDRAGRELGTRDLDTGLASSKRTSCQTGSHDCNEHDFVGHARPRSLRWRDRFALASFGNPETKLMSRRLRSPQMGGRGRASPSKGWEQMDADTGSASLSVVARSGCPTHCTGARTPASSASSAAFRSSLQPRRAVARRISAFRRPLAHGSAQSGPGAGDGRSARSLPRGRLGGRHCESSTWPTRCSSTPPIPRRRALS